MFPLKIMSIKHRLFSFHLQITTCFHEVSSFPCGTDAFNADTPLWWWCEVRGGVGRWDCEGWREQGGRGNETREGRRVLIERLSSQVFGTVWPCPKIAVKEKSALWTSPFHHPSFLPSSIPPVPSSPVTLYFPFQK